MFANSFGAKSQKIISSKTRVEFAYITNTSSSGKNMSLQIDIIQMLTGKDAVFAARKKGEAEYDIKKGDTTWYVPNDFYIVNNSTRKSKINISPGADILLVREGGSDLVKSTFQKLKHRFEGKIFKLTIKEFMVRKIEEVYTP